MKLPRIRQDNIKLRPVDVELVKEIIEQLRKTQRHQNELALSIERQSSDRRIVTKVQTASSGGSGSSSSATVAADKVDSVPLALGDQFVPFSSPPMTGPYIVDAWVLVTIDGEVVRGNVEVVEADMLTTGFWVRNTTNAGTLYYLAFLKR